MRTFRLLSVLWASFLFHPAQAQLLNGSFEASGAPSLVGWEWTCNPPGQPNEGAPGSGAWCANKGPGETQGCFPSYIYQRLPDLADGAMTTLSGWIRCSDEEPCVGGFISIGTLNNGVITTGAAVGSQLPVWSYVFINQTIALGPGDTAVAVLNGGLIGGPVAASPTYFDGITLEIVLGTNEIAAPELAHYRDAASFNIACRNCRMLDLRLLDLTGRAMASIVERNANTYRIGLEGLGTGVYFAAVRTDRGEKAIRFVVE
ncbi:MAG: hypothetical protein IPL52_06915 [Flavobacteriales bacterium]|nr:hypothetical protein [Flavobacteriales bacterium]